MPRKFNILHGELEDEDEQYRRQGYAKRNVRSAMRSAAT